METSEPTPYNPAEPVVIFETDSYRGVLRPLTRWSEGVIDVEARREDAMGGVSWHAKCCVTLNTRGRQTDEQEVLMELCAAAVALRGIQVRPR